MNLQPDRFNQFLNRVGQSVLWRRAHECPCRDPNSNAPSPACRVCTNGRIWNPPVCATVALSGQKVQQQWSTSGIYEKGDVVCTLPGDSPTYGLGEFDRVLFTDSTEPFSIALVNTAPQKLRFTAVQFDRLFWLTPDLASIVEGSIPTQADDGTLRFGRLAPPIGTQFTVTGRRNPEYFCFLEFPQDRAHFHGERLPRKVVLRNFDLFSRAA